MARLIQATRGCLWTVLGGCYLATLYLLVVVMVVYSLSILQFRSTLGDSFTISTILAARDRIEAQEKAILDSVELDPTKVAVFDEFRDAQDRAFQEIAALKAGEPLHALFDTYTFHEQAGSLGFLYMPSEVLIFMVTIFMGALGSLIAMTWSFIRGDSGLTLRRFIILPLVGSTSAFVVLVFLKAGQLTLTAGNSADALDPFVLSFFGIISGLLSERAYLKISHIGGNVFSVEDRQPRWGIGLAAHLEAACITIDDLAAHLGTTKEEAERIVNEKAHATLDQQRLIGALLRRSHRDVFTDMPPPAEIEARRPVLALPRRAAVGGDGSEPEPSLN